MPNLPDVLDFDELGGAKQNYSDPADTKTDLDASFGNLARIATSAMSRTADRAWLKFSYSGSVSLLDYDTVWGKSDLTAPSISRSSAGVFLATFPATVTDELGVSHNVNLRAGQPSLENSSLTVSLEINSPTTATFRVFSGSTPTDPTHAVVGTFK